MAPAMPYDVIPKDPQLSLWNAELSFGAYGVATIQQSLASKIGECAVEMRILAGVHSWMAF